MGHLSDGRNGKGGRTAGRRIPFVFYPSSQVEALGYVVWRTYAPENRRPEDLPATGQPANGQRSTCEASRPMGQCFECHLHSSAIVSAGELNIKSCTSVCFCFLKKTKCQDETEALLKFPAGHLLPCCDAAVGYGDQQVFYFFFFLKKKITIKEKHISRR